MMPLTMAKAGETVTIRRISGKDEVRQHLAELGFVVDTEAMGEDQPFGNVVLVCRVPLAPDLATGGAIL